jgi:hypothetical protein
MMADKIDSAIADLKARDAQAYRKARTTFHQAEAAWDLEGKALAALGRKPYQTLERYLVRTLKPHRVEWRYVAPSAQANGGGDVDGRDYSVGVHLSGEITTAGPWKSRMSASVPFSLSPRDSAEFRRQVAILKAGLDAMQEAGL